MPVALRDAAIYFLIQDIANVNSIHQLSLNQFLGKFFQSIEEAEPDQITQIRINNIIGTLTTICYQYIVHGLYEKDKLLFLSSSLSRYSSHSVTSTSTIIRSFWKAMLHFQAATEWPTSSFLRCSHRSRSSKATQAPSQRISLAEKDHGEPNTGTRADTEDLWEYATIPQSCCYSLSPSRLRDLCITHLHYRLAHQRVPRVHNAIAQQNPEISRLSFTCSVLVQIQLRSLKSLQRNRRRRSAQYQWVRAEKRSQRSQYSRQSTKASGFCCRTVT